MKTIGVALVVTGIGLAVVNIACVVIDWPSIDTLALNGTCAVLSAAGAASTACRVKEMQ